LTTHIEGKRLDDIRHTTQSGMALGNDRFKRKFMTFRARHLQALPS
jgi:hypothetical protein